MMQDVRAHFRPELLNRLDDIIVFEPLTQDEIGQIVDIQMERVKKLLEGKNLSMVMDARAKELLAQRGYDPVYGARPLKRLITDIILNPLANKLLSGEFKSGDTMTISANAKGDIVFDRGGNSGKRVSAG
jgi:ATP-dependent Clp protease ATP-binding subunit ClpA